MNTIIELWNGATKALISTEGAWLTNLSDDNGDVIFPTRLFTAPNGEQKKRGGCHVCLPNFDAPGGSGLERHGFGRLLTWEVEQQTEASVRLVLAKGIQGYEGLESHIVFTLASPSLSMALELHNLGNTPLRVAPGFHPYFALRASEGRVSVNNTPHNLDDLGGTLYQDGPAMVLATKQRHIRLQTAQLTRWALWTDRLGPYVCVEPTLCGPSFVQEQASTPEIIEAGSSRAYSFTISW